MQAVRDAVGPEMPVMVASDLHANIDGRVRNLVAALFGYHYSPHTDMDETGRRAARCMVETLRGKVAPVMAIRKPDVMLPSIFTATSVPPLSDIVAEGFAWERDHDGIIDVSIFCGFAYADVPQVGFTVVVVTDGDQALADRAADALAERIWNTRKALLHKDLVSGLADGVARAIDISARRSGPWCCWNTRTA